MVISTQPTYLREVGDWIAKIDHGGGNEPDLYVYDVRNIKASDLAQYLAQIYTNGANANGNNGKVGPGLNSGTLGGTENAYGSASGMGSTAGSFGSSTTGGFGNSAGGLSTHGDTGTTTGGLGGNTGLGGGTTGGGAFGSTGGAFGNSNNAHSNQGGQQYSSEDGSIRISSVDANNQLMVRARPSQWGEIEQAIKKLDNVPLQVQIETRILEVDLTGQFQFGVQWYLQGLSGGTNNGDGTFTPGDKNNQRQISLGQGGNTYNPGTSSSPGDALFYSFVNKNFQVALRALEVSGNTKTLSAPSMVVLNNQVAHIQVGNQIPVNQTSIVTGLGTTTTGSTASSVTYLPTGVILNVQPRVNPGGLVYLTVQQQVSNTIGIANDQGNYTIQQRAVGTQIAVQSGQTVLLGGLIQQNEDNTEYRHSRAQPNPVPGPPVRHHQPQPQPHRVDRADYAAGDHQQRRGQAGDRRIPAQVRIAGAVAGDAHHGDPALSRYSLSPSGEMAGVRGGCSQKCRVEALRKPRVP